MAGDVIDSLKNKYQGKKVLVVGLGLQGGGVGIAKFFCELGAKVTVTDKKTENQLAKSVNELKTYPVTFHLNGHILSDFLQSDVIFKGPSVLWTIPEIVSALKKNIPVEMEMPFFVKNFPGKIIGITGTRGKSTTTYMIFNLLKESGFPVYLGGGLPNISTINYLKSLTKDDWIVMELSSWALSGFHKDKISPHIAVFTNIYPDHLNYYKNMEEYVFDKSAIYKYQTDKDYLIINDKTQVQSTTKSKILSFNKNNFPYSLKYLKGEHNLENASACLKVAQILKIDKEKAVKSISQFKGLPYRQQIIKEKNGVVFVNDTTSTTPVATIKAIDSFNDKKIILLLGGNSKNLPTEMLLKNLDKVEKIVLLAGSFTEKIYNDLKRLYPDKITNKVYNNLNEAVDHAYKIALGLGKSYVLFSPGATSFAMFNNEFHRGDEFNLIVEKL